MIKRERKTLVYTMTPRLARALREWRPAFKKWYMFQDVEELEVLEDRERQLLAALDAQVVTTPATKKRRAK